MTRILFILFLHLTVHFCIIGQENASVSDTLSIDSTGTKINEKDENRITFLDLVKGEPGKAALYSTLIPGGGQWYNRIWWKVPIAVGIDAFNIYNVIDSRSTYKNYQRRYEQALIDKDPSTNRLRLFRDSARKRYDYARVYLVLGHLVTIIDAYVDRHLMDFDISDDLSMGPRIINNPISSPHTGIGLVYNISQ